MLAFIAVLGIAAEFIEPLGNWFEGQSFLGGSLAAFVALILFDAISGSEPKELSGVYVLADLDDLLPPVKEAFEARHIRIDFSGFSMETLLKLLRAPLDRMSYERVNSQQLTLRIIIAHLNLPMSLPGKLEPAPESAGLPAGTVFFTDSPENRERMQENYTKPNWHELKGLLDRVHERNPHITISCEVRESPQIPERKFYILNQEKIFHQPYGIMEARILWRENTHRILDTAGFGLRYGKARIIGWDMRSNSRATQEVAEHHMEWHRNLWDTLQYIKPVDPVITDPQWVPPEERSTG
ncbi:hypothetical protein QF026_004098 [Streptomyces aurantiacus]|uniref:hypothetical protein n=1 Tax=Streptomyces aurantiacus TaxID=47760 RepID=UPI002790C931|nr:hypothetical protein [Streptomyces aurantiacus]MDQ0775632.1 hypothetical protein [Streptomyces aurantiacus]